MCVKGVFSPMKAKRFFGKKFPLCYSGDIAGGLLKMQEADRRNLVEICRKKSRNAKNRDYYGKRNDGGSVFYDKFFHFCISSFHGIIIHQVTQKRY